MNTAPYFSSIYPVPDKSISYSRLSESVTGATPTPLIDASLAIDTANLELKRFLAGLDKMAGVVGPNYFSVHGKNSNVEGITISVAGVLNGSVLASTAQSVPHEIAHTYGAGERYTVDSNGLTIYDGTSIHGYDAFNQRNYDNSVSRVWSIMGPPLISGILADDYWMDDATYNLIFNKLSPSPDPAVVLVTGTLSSTGQFTFGPTATLDSGVVTPSDPGGDVMLSTLDNSGKVLSSVQVVTNFSAQLIYAANSVAGPPTISLGAVPVIAELPFDPTISTFQISKNGKVIQTASIYSQSLQGLIWAIPVDEFRERGGCHSRHCESQDQIAKEDREELNKVIEVIQNQINAKRYIAAVALLDALTLEIRALTSDTYLPTDPSQLSQVEVLTALQDISKQLRDSSKCCTQSNDTTKHKRFDFLLRHFCR